MNAPDSTRWFSLLFPPERFKPLQIMLPGNQIKTGVWTGSTWWCDGMEVTPCAWRPLYKPELQATG